MSNYAILILVTSHDRVTEDLRTGVWFEEFAVPYERFVEKRYAVTVASPAGGESPIDARSLKSINTGKHADAIDALTQTKALSEIEPADFDAVFVPGGHGPMYDLANNPQVAAVIAEFYEAGKPVAAMCHGPACLIGVKLSDGKALVDGRRLTAFSDAEERQAGLDSHMPFLLESELRKAGAQYECTEPWQKKVVVDRNLITGQNPASSAEAAENLIHAVERGRAAA